MKYITKYIRKSIKIVFIIIPILLCIISTVVPVSANSISYDQSHNRNKGFHNNLVEPEGIPTIASGISVVRQNVIVSSSNIFLEVNSSVAAEMGVTDGSALVRTLQYDKPGHGAARLVQRGITEKMAETTINKGSMFFDSKNGTINYILEGGFASGKDLLIGTNPINGAIKTGIRGSNLVRPRMIPLR